MKITIIGAGIGGLTTAIALKNKGFEVEIFESTPAFKSAGSGINLAINAMQVYKKLGLYDIIFKAGSHTNAMVITNEKLKTLSVIDLIPFEKRFGVQSVAIHRAKLHQILLDQLTETPIHLNKKVNRIQQSKNGIELDFEDGTFHKANILIGADGIHSVVRKSIINDSEIRKAHQVCWRGITKLDLPEKHQIQLTESWGKGKRFGFVAIGKNEYYWYALADYTKNYQEEFRDVNLDNYYSDFNPIVSKIINTTPKENLLTNEMLDLKPISTWHKGNICLLGDSAHATTPNLGQGACQAIESALVLVDCLAKHKIPTDSFLEFEQRRMKKAKNVVNTSWRVGKISQINNSLLIAIRNFVLKLTPKKIASKQSERMFTIHQDY